MAVAYVNGSSASIASGTALTVNAPASIVAGNMLVAICGTTTSGNANIFGQPGDWTKVSIGVSTAAQTIFTKICTGSEPSTYAFTCDASMAASIMVMQFSGAAMIMDAPVATATVNPGTTLNFPSATATLTTDVLVCAITGFASTSFSTPAGMTAGVAVTGTATGGATFYQSITSTGATGTRSTTIGTSSSYQGASFLLRPSSLPDLIGATSAVLGGTPLTISCPSGVQNNDVLVAVCTSGNNGTNFFAPPTGWTLVNWSTTGGNAQSLMTKTASSEPSTYSFTTTNSPGGIQATVFAFRGVFLPLDAGPSFVTGFSGITMPSLTASGTADILLDDVGGGGANWLPPAGVMMLTGQGTVQNFSNNPASAVKLLSTSGATGTRAWTSSVGTASAGVSALLTGVAPPSASLPLGPFTLTSSGSAPTVTSTSCTVALGPLTVTTLAVWVQPPFTIPLGPLTLTTTSQAFAQAYLPLGPLTTTVPSTLSGGGGSLARATRVIS